MIQNNRIVPKKQTSSVHAVRTSLGAEAGRAVDKTFAAVPVAMIVELVEAFEVEMVAVEVPIGVVVEPRVAEVSETSCDSESGVASGAEVDVSSAGEFEFVAV